MLAEKNHGRDPDAPSDQQRPRAIAAQLERDADRPHEIQDIAGALLRQQLGPKAVDLVQDIDLSLAPLDPHDGHGTPHQDCRITLDVNEVARLRAGGGLRR